MPMDPPKFETLTAHGINALCFYFDKDEVTRKYPVFKKRAWLIENINRPTLRTINWDAMESSFPQMFTRPESMHELKAFVSDNEPYLSNPPQFDRIAKLVLQVAALCDAMKNLERAIDAVSQDENVTYYISECTKRRERVAKELPNLMSGS